MTWPPGSCSLTSRRRLLAAVGGSAVLVQPLRSNLGPVRKRGGSSPFPKDGEVDVGRG